MVISSYGQCRLTSPVLFTGSNSFSGTKGSCTAKGSSGRSSVRSCGGRTSTSPVRQARIDREREDAIQKEIDDIAAEKAAKEARLEILKRGGKTKKPKKEITPEERARKQAELEAQRLRQRAAEEEMRVERKRQVRVRLVEKIRAGDANALSDRAREYLTHAGVPTRNDEDMCAAIVEERHFAEMFDECIERAAVDDRAARAEAQRLEQETPRRRRRG